MLRAVNGIGELSGVVAKVIGTKFFTPWTIGSGKRWPLLKQCILTLVQSGLYTMKENTPEGPEEVNGYSCYIVADTEEGIKKELAAVAGCAPSDIVMWAFDEFIRVPQYKAV